MPSWRGVAVKERLLCRRFEGSAKKEATIMVTGRVIKQQPRNEAYDEGKLNEVNRTKSDRRREKENDQMIMWQFIKNQIVTTRTAPSGRSDHRARRGTGCRQFRAPD
jgi:hypothetical protein